MCLCLLIVALPDRSMFLHGSVCYLSYMYVYIQPVCVYMCVYVCDYCKCL